MNQCAEIVANMLIENNRTITFMESCTSGLIASMLTDVEGASSIFKGSFVTYSNEAKIMAGVSKETIECFGVYSAQCAQMMAQKCRDAFNADIAIGITGTTGNVDPANEDSVQGVAFFCILADGKFNDFCIHENVCGLKRCEIKKLYADKVYEALASVLEIENI